MTEENTYHWLETGDRFYSDLLAAIDSARTTVRLETYIFAAGKPGDDVRSSLVRAVKRGVRVRVLVDGFGSLELPSEYWEEFATAGGECRVFNPLSLHRMAIRDHRKLLVCDSNVAFVGGFNISGEEAGDGVTRGWRDLGLRLTGNITTELAASFDQMFDTASFKHRRLPRLHMPVLFSGKLGNLQQVTVLTSKPGSPTSPIKNALLDDLRKASSIRVISAYFLPTLQLMRVLKKSARRGGDVRIIAAGKSDVPLARYAGRSLYQGFLRAGIKVYEYDTQILHTKLIIADNVVYVGSANMDTRSMNINYELLVRIDDPGLAREACRIFQSYIPHCTAIERSTWKKARGAWEKIIERFAHFLLARIDTYFARRQLSKLR